MIRPLLAALALGLVLIHPLQAQDADERWQVTLNGDKYVWDIRLVKLDGDTLVVRQSDSLRRLPVADITEVRLIRKTKVEIGGAAGGGAMSALIGGDDEVYDLTPLDFSERLRTIQKIFLYHPVKQ
ncbi:MAG TPA: hypothetical protein VH763_15800 [Gemmatimonadales bacterium]|jgi:hypothetical protein